MTEPYDSGSKSNMIERLSRRAWIVGGGSIALLSGLWWWRDDGANAGPFEVSKSEDEWRRSLTPAQFHVLRNHGTERPYSSRLNADKRNGTFACAGCDLPLFDSAAKFESGTGWPSFYQPLPGAVETSPDRSLIMPRTEVHCRRCGGHLGHVFEDGPPPTGLRSCINGVALRFAPQVEMPA